MHPNFERIYRELVEYYRASQGSQSSPWPRWAQSPLNTLGVVSEAIERVRLPSGKYLRADARLFLLANLHQMVALPLSHSEAPEKLTDVEEDLRKDVVTIVDASVERAGTRADIAASHVLWGAGDALDTLNLKGWRLWEQE